MATRTTSVSTRTTTTETPRQTWVACADGEWQVLKDCAEKAIKRFRTQKAAIKFARRVARNERGELVIQASDGRIREKNSVKLG